MKNKIRHLFHHTLAPLFLLICCPPMALLMWEINVKYQGSVASFAEQVRAVGFFTELVSAWEPVVWGTAAGWKIIGTFAAVQLLLMRVVPGRRFCGPTTPKGYVPVYRANGVACFLISLGSFLLGGFVFNWFEPTIVYDNFAGIIGALNVFSLAFCLLLYCKGRFFPSGPDGGLSGNFIFDYYWGTELYPRILGWDVKMFTNCRFGLMGWPIIVLSFAAKQAELGGLSDSMVVALIVMLTYLVKFFVWETGYLCSIDIMHDRAGFMICWGCLVWVPAIYTSPILYLVHHPHQLGMGWSAGIAALGVGAVMINYFADRQRQVVRGNGRRMYDLGEKAAAHCRQVLRGKRREKRDRFVGVRLVGRGAALSLCAGNFGGLLLDGAGPVFALLALFLRDFSDDFVGASRPARRKALPAKVRRVLG